MYSRDEYSQLKKTYGSLASWAVWDRNNDSDTSVIERNIDRLHSRFVFVGLNISVPRNLDHWQNFHGGKHDRKLKYACQGSILSGSYITDLFKCIPEVKSSQFKKYLTSEVIEQNVQLFCREMKDILVTDETVFILLGRPSSILVQCFDTYFRPYFSINRVITYYHYSYYRLTDRQWVDGLRAAYMSVLRKELGKRHISTKEIEKRKQMKL